MKILKKIAIFAVAAVLVLTAGGCTNYDKMMKDEPMEYISMAAENAFKGAAVNGFEEEARILSEAQEDGTFTLGFEVQGVTVSAECYTSDERSSILCTLAGGDDAVQLYGYADKDKLKFGLGNHVYDVLYDGLEEKLAGSIFAVGSGSEYALEQSEYDQLLEYAAALRGGEDNAYAEIISDFAEEHPPVTEKDVEITVSGETVKANRITYEIGTEDAKPLMERIFDQYLEEAGDEAEYTKEEFTAELDSIEQCAAKAVFAVNSDSHALMTCDLTFDMTTYDPEFDERSTARAYMNGDFGADPASAQKQTLVVGTVEDEDVTEVKLDGSRTENGYDVAVSGTMYGETAEIGTISCMRDGDNYTISANVPELEVTAKIEGTITCADDSFTLTIDKISAASGASEVSYAPKGVITVAKGGVIAELDAEMEFLDITEEQLDAVLEEFDEQLSAVLETTETGSEMLDYVDSSKTLMANSNAKTVYNAVSANFVERDINGYALPGSDFTGDGPFILIDGQLDDLSDYTGDDFYGNSYGEYNSDEYSVEYVLWSEEPIPDDCKRQLSEEEQEELAERGTIIGCYPIS